MIRAIGEFSLFFALALAAYASIASWVGWRIQRGEWIRSGESALLAVCGLLTLSTAALTYALVTHDFSLAYVVHYSNRTQPMAYTVSALYGGNDGSLLFWAWMLAAFASVVVIQNRHRHRDLMPHVVGVMGAIAFFFVGVMLLLANPFTRLPVAPPDGRGLNPLLQNPGMFFHPPTTYIGYVGFTVPFAFAIAALITGRLGTTWILSTRRWTIFAWFFLGLGNMFGAWWAYNILGWGGYWAWDPVENASFMPWLTGTAYLHSVMIQEKKGMLKVWNMSLIIVTFALSIFGTFLTRSGILSSVHTFSQGSLGYFFLGFLALILVVSFGLLLHRLPALQSQNELDSFLSRESSFLFNNLMLVGIAFATLWGTVFPLIAEAVRGVKVTVGPPFYNQVTIPLGLALLLLTGVCPLIAWRRASWRNLQRNFLLPAAIGLLGGAGLYLWGIRDPVAWVTLLLLMFVAATIGMEFARGTGARQQMTGEGRLRALVMLTWRNKRRYGGYIIHLGALFMILAMVGGIFKQEAETFLKRGESMRIGQYQVHFRDFREIPRRDSAVLAAEVHVSNAGKPLGTLLPQKRFHPGSEQPHSMVGVMSSPREDLYLILVNYSKEGAAIKALINPLMMWMWIGSYVMAAGVIIVMWPDRRQRFAARYSVEDRHALA
ncbi:MAG: heme lyase CcmF/NrfE family subunit [candidate division NC10 bacterium]|nr:heme lyase CcmF/NrfE family subunit [candidate division NC10 bacterium]